MPYNFETSRSGGVLTSVIPPLPATVSLAYSLDEWMFLVRENITAPGAVAVLIFFKLFRFSALEFVFLGWWFWFEAPVGQLPQIVRLYWFFFGALIDNMLCPLEFLSSEAVVAVLVVFVLFIAGKFAFIFRRLSNYYYCYLSSSSSWCYYTKLRCCWCLRNYEEETFWSRFWWPPFDICDC